MLTARVVIVQAENSDGICNIGLSGGHRVDEVSDHRFVYGRIAGFLGRLPLVKLRCHQCGNWSGLLHSELRQDRPDVAVLMDVDRVMLPIAFDVHPEIEGDTPKIMHPKPHLHLILDLPNQALVSNDMEIIDVQNDCGDEYTLILKHQQSTVVTRCHDPNRAHEVLECTIQNVRRLF